MRLFSLENCIAPSFEPGSVDLGLSLARAGELVLPQSQSTPVSPFSGAGGCALFAVLEGKCALSLPSRTVALSEFFAVALRGERDVSVEPYEGAKTCRIVFAEMAGSAAEALLHRLPETAFSPFDVQRDPRLIEALRALAAQVQGGQIPDAYDGAQRAFALLAELGRRFGGKRTKEHPDLVRHAVAMIEAEYEYLYGVDELAQALEVSKHHLIREFTRHMGVSPGKYLAQTRIENAKKLLAADEHSVEIIGQLVGYANGNYFCKAFRSHVGMSPGEFRNRLQEL